MNRLAYCLTPYRLPGLHTMMLTGEDVSALWNGYLVLWHPAVVRCCTEPPQLASPYDHEQPSGPHIYTLPETPPLFLPDDWEDRVRQAGGKSVHVGLDRSKAQQDVLLALEVPPERHDDPAPFYGLGLGYGLLQAFFEGMQHPPVLATGEFWADVRAAAESEDAATRRQLLQAAAQRLREARESLYGGTIYWLAILFADQLAANTVLSNFLQLDLPCNVVVSGETLRKWAQENPEAWEQLRQRVQQERLELCAGPWCERADALLPVASQLWNLRQGVAVWRELLGTEPRVFARRRFGYTPAFPSYLHALGLSRMLFLPLNEGVIPEYRATTIEWTSPDGHRVEAITRRPLPGDDPLTFFHLAYHLIKTIREDTSPNLVLLYKEPICSELLRDLLELHSLAPVFGEFVTANRLMNEVPVGEYPPPPSADDFHSCYLDDLVAARAPDPISRFARHYRQRRALDATWTLAALWRAIVPKDTDTSWLARLEELENALESGEDIESSLAGLAQQAMQRLAERLLSRAQGTEPGHLVFNACPMVRRVATVLDNISTPLPHPAKATQPVGGGKAEVVVEVPGLGFAWLPHRVAPGTLVAVPKTKLAEENSLRNEFFEAEIDPQTGGLRSFRDYKWRHNRLGQILAFGPGSEMRAEQIEVLSSGPSRGEIVSRGVILDGQQQCLARFQQRFRVWRGYPLLHLEITIEPASPLELPQESETPYGTVSPWHTAYVARWAWRDSQTRLFRAIAGNVYPTQHTRPETAEYIEMRTPFSRTTLFTGGLPFLQRHSQRMLDVILLCPGESARSFELAIGLELEEPGQLATAWLTPPLTIPVAKGPPHVGATGWLAWIDAENVSLVSLRVPTDGTHAWLVRLQETRGVATECSLRCPRNPVHACVVDEWNQPQHDLTVQEDAVQVFLGANELVHLRVEFS